jgi:hypothetical protein
MPKYETEQSLRGESAVAKLIEERRDVSLEKLNPVYRLDYAAFRNGEVTSFLEIKCRTFERDKYETTLINAHKIMSANDITQAFRRPAFLVVSWTDWTGFISFENLSQYRIGMGGRTDRGDPKDWDICCFIPVSEFKEL